MTHFGLPTSNKQVEGAMLRQADGLAEIKTLHNQLAAIVGAVEGSQVKAQEILGYARHMATRLRNLPSLAEDELPSTQVISAVRRQRFEHASHLRSVLSYAGHLQLLAQILILLIDPKAEQKDPSVFGDDETPDPARIHELVDLALAARAERALQK